MNYPIAEPDLRGRAREYVLDCIDSGWVSSKGAYVKAFETLFAERIGTRHALTTANGTVSLHLILLALGIGKGDEVILPAMTYVATANSVKYVDATPVYVDSDPVTFNIDVAQLERRITSKTKAIFLVHVYGNPCDMDAIMAIAERHHLPVIEDAAESLYADYKGRRTGSFGVANSFSFFGNKIITTGEGGMVTTDSDELYERMQLLKNQGASPTMRYHHVVLGYNYRMTNIQAAIGLAQLEEIDHFIAKKRRINAWYRMYLAPLVQNGVLSFQEPTPGSDPSYWMNAFVLHGIDKEAVVRLLEGQGIETRPFFAPMNSLPHLKTSERFPVAERLYAQGLILPSGTKLEESDVRKICHALIDIVQHRGATRQGDESR